jgi:hypothetical protein
VPGLFWGLPRSHVYKLGVHLIIYRHGRPGVDATDSVLQLNGAQACLLLTSKTSGLLPAA